MSEHDKEECLIKIDWDSLWGEMAATHKIPYSRSTEVVSTTEQIITKYINISINNIINNNTNINTKLEVIKEIYRSNYNDHSYLTAIKHISHVTNMSLKEAKDIVNVWKEELSTTKEV